ncbi:MAG: hypothetical protein HOW73_38445 [Polyangiaceae bacterium]|nr:hypothetical protein [Polyangiaceae bacterium]
MTRRSRSSFDLRDALTTAEALSPKPPQVQTTSEYEGVPLVAFGGSEIPPSFVPTERVVPAAPQPKPALGPAPDVMAVSGMTPRLSTLMDWLRTDPEITRVIVVDDEGLPLIGSTVGDLSDAESLLAATGSVASAMKKLALATPGALSRDFEGHVGDGPVLQLVGLSAGTRGFVVGISRRRPLGQRDVEAVRAAFARALSGAVVAGAPVGGRPGTGRSGET